VKRASVGEAKAHFSALIKRAEAGEEVLVTRSGTPVAMIVPAKSSKRRVFANDEGLGFVPDDFDDPLPAELLKQFYR
jgi:prevent-host-death family protein